MEAREEFTRLMVWLVQQVDEVDTAMSSKCRALVDADSVEFDLAA